MKQTTEEEMFLRRPSSEPLRFRGVFRSAKYLW